MERKPPRIEVVRRVAKEMLSAADGCGVDDMSVGELTSACFTICRHVTMTLLEMSEGAEREHNRQQIVNAVAEIYELVKPNWVN